MKTEDIDRAIELFASHKRLTEDIDNLKYIIEKGVDAKISITNFPSGTTHRIEVDFRNIVFSKQVAALMTYEMEAKLKMVETKIAAL